MMDGVKRGEEGIIGCFIIGKGRCLVVYAF
jgi:hypothetical protein